MTVFEKEEQVLEFEIKQWIVYRGESLGKTRQTYWSVRSDYKQFGPIVVVAL